MNLKIKRLLAALIDYWIICFIASAFIFILTLGKSSVTPLSVTIYLLVAFTLLLTKDFAFKNASIGKRIFKLKIVKRNGTNLTKVDIVKRNISLLVLLAIEVFLIISNNSRIGDIWAKTSVVVVEPK